MPLPLEIIVGVVLPATQIGRLEIARGGNCCVVLPANPQVPVPVLPVAISHGTSAKTQPLQTEYLRTRPVVLVRDYEARFLRFYVRTSRPCGMIYKGLDLIKDIIQNNES